MYSRILVPLDGSPLAEKALPFAVDLAQNRGSELILLRARALPQAYYVGGELSVPPALTQVSDEEEEKQAMAYLEGVRERLGLSTPVTLLAPAGQAAEVILDAAEQFQVSLLIIASHGRTGMERWLVGSVAERVLRHAHCPTMVIPGKTLRDIP